ncbi:hypothetical protein BDF14DRAFT_1789475 [Spinellus fusiger]|nr:hypothetical protein BDF14DRAFT_1789475 [Spinellus fusiger]
MYLHPFIENRMMECQVTKLPRSYSSSISRARSSQRLKRIGPLHLQVDLKDAQSYDTLFKPQGMVRYIDDKAAFKHKAKGLQKIITNFTLEVAPTQVIELIHYPDTPQLTTTNSTNSINYSSEAAAYMCVQHELVKEKNRRVECSLSPASKDTETSVASTPTLESKESIKTQANETYSSVSSSRSPPLLLQTVALSLSKEQPKRNAPWLKPPFWTKVSSAACRLFHKPSLSLHPMASIKRAEGADYSGQVSGFSEDSARDPKRNQAIAASEMERWHSDPWREPCLLLPDSSSYTPPSHGVLYCKVIQISNIGSSKAYNYSLQVQCNGTTMFCHPGTMKKVANHKSGAKVDETFSFPVSAPSSIEFILKAQPPKSAANVISHGFKKAKTILYATLIPIAEHSKSGKSTPITGYKRIELQDSADCVVSGRHMHPMKDAQDTTKGWAPEITVFYKYVPKHSPTTFDMEVLRANQAIESALLHCTHGDYLTLYTHGHGCPLWTRYWAKLNDGHIFLYRLSNETKDAFDSISLKDLCHTTMASDTNDDIFLGRHGLVLKFGRSYPSSVSLVEKESVVEERIYFFTDTPLKTVYWQQVLNAHIGTVYPRNYSSEVNSRYLW